MKTLSNNSLGIVPSVNGLKIACISMAMGAIFTASPLVADDTEVFFGEVEASAETQPNVMFVLDTSGSMKSTDGTGVTRLQRMKNAMIDILDSSANVNVGMMRFNGGSGGGAVLYPVTPIDDTVCEANNCGDLHLISRINDEANDAKEYLHTNVVDIDSFGLPMGVSESGTARAVGLRFDSMEIPQGVDLTHAKLEFTAKDDYSGPAILEIRAELVPSAAAFAENNGDISGRTMIPSAPVIWTAPVWFQKQIYQTPDLTSILQPVIDQADWCGGNALSIKITGTGLRRAISHEQSPSDAPALKLSYDSTSVTGGGGCALKTIVSQVSSGSDDAEQNLSNNKVERDSSDLEFARDGSNDQLIGMRFRNINIPQGSIIESASIEFEVDEERTGPITVKFFGHDTDSSYKFKEKKFHISNRTKTAAFKSWNIPTAPKNAKISTPDLKDIVQEIVDRGGWSAGNSMAIIVEKESGTGYREFESFNGEQVAAPKLRVNYYGTSVSTPSAPSYITARDKLKQVVNDMTAYGGTPIVDAYLEASNYYRAAPVDYGLERGNYGGHRYHRVSTPLSWANGSINRSSGCTDEDLDDTDCASETLQGSPSYISPMSSSCQTNHIVLLSDGEATSNSSSGKVMALTGDTSCVGSDPDEKCGVELAHWLANEDHGPYHDEMQNITTYTIGFNNNDQFLQDIATAGGGTYSTADSSDELVTVFQTILSDVLSVDTSFVAPAATVNQFNRLTHNSSIYFALFKPNTQPRWSGNLKRYRVGSDGDGGVAILDYDGADGKPAVDEESGFFSTEAVSRWGGGTVDGSSVTLGGAAAEFSNLSGRNVYTYTGDVDNIPTAGANLTLSIHELNENNSDITDAMLGIASMSNVDNARTNYRTALLKWTRGVDINDENGDGSNTDIRQHMGDPMHSRPVILNYAGTGSDYDAMIFLATNEGFLHAIHNGENDDDNPEASNGGQEQWAFMPQELLANITDNYNNNAASGHPYGLDGALSAWVTDTNDNLKIDSGEEAYLYIGMRRGGSNLYAIDVSNRLAPKLAWQIRGGSAGTTGFEEMGETWSRPVPSKIVFNGAERDVIIFAGGYDINQDPDESGLDVPRTVDSIGRAIYIVDARTGEKVWSATGVIGDGQYFSDMKYSIPADIRVIDIDFDGLTDQFYVGDMGGQIWRFDVKQHHQSSHGDLLEGGVLAKLGSDNLLVNNRRFYYEPDVSLINKDGERFLAIAIGSGWRAHPLAESNADRFYMIRSNHIYGAPAGGDYRSELSPGVFGPITDNQLVDVTNDIDPTTNKFGWRMDLPHHAEKVLGDAITINNQIIFTTYRPDTNVGNCSTAIGTGGVYVVDVVDASPTLDLDDDGDIDVHDREKQLKHGGIPPEATALIVEADGDIKPTILVGTEQPIEPEFNNLTQRSYWVDLGNDSN